MLFRSEGYVTTYLEESQEGPPRKYYKLTSRGEEVFEELEVEWESFIDGVNSILRGEVK